jgi:hypothetical protein
VLAFVPPAGAEAVRAWQARRLRPLVWTALAAAAVPLAFCLPLIRAARTYADHFWARPGAASLAEFAAFLFGAALIPLGVLLAAAGVSHLLRDPEKAVPARAEAPRFRPPADELAAVLLFLATPVLALLLAATVTGAFAPRYAISAAIGAGVLPAWLLAAAFRSRARPAVMAVCLLSGFFVLRAAHELRQAARKDAVRAGTIAFLSARTHPELPVLIADPHLFFELSHEAPATLRRRLFYFAEPELALARLGTATMDRCLTELSRWAPLRLESFREFLSSGRTVLVYGYPAYGEWVVGELLARRANLSILGAHEGRLLLAATAAPAGVPVSSSLSAYPGTRARR